MHLFVWLQKFRHTKHEAQTKYADAHARAHGVGELLLAFAFRTVYPHFKSFRLIYLHFVTATIVITAIYVPQSIHVHKLSECDFSSVAADDWVLCVCRTPLSLSHACSILYRQSDVVMYPSPLERSFRSPPLPCDKESRPSVAFHGYPLLFVALFLPWTHFHHGSTTSSTVDGSLAPEIIPHRKGSFRVSLW